MGDADDWQEWLRGQTKDITEDGNKIKVPKYSESVISQATKHAKQFFKYAEKKSGSDATHFMT